MKESKKLRDLLKAEALKMFNKEYDVLYLLIKDKKLENNIRVDEIIAKHLGGKEKLDEIIFKNPTLTILIPELPNNSFSAKLWNAQSDIPAIAIRTNKTGAGGGIPFIKTDGTESIIPMEYTPGFPILVIKDNERVVISNSRSRNYKGFNQIKTRTLYNSDGIKLEFWSNAFDNSIKHIGRKRNVLYPDSKLKDAYNIYKYADGWQRDYIYYNITPYSPNGHYRYNYKEYITSFSMEGDPVNAYYKIADQTSDPNINDKIRDIANSWTDGYFEFRIITNVNSKNSVGEQLINGITVNPNDLFHLTYKRKRYWLFWHKYHLTNISLKTLSINLPLFNWRLEDHSSTIKFSIEEVDLTETFRQKETRTAQFATNFSVNPEEGIMEKIGLKFGGKKSETKTQTTQITYTKESDFLGEAIVNFADDVLIGEGNSIAIREYSTGLCKFSVEPIRVQ